jgi:Zn finger protein HypA/HybF involved in hydrogenase expression
MTYKRNCPNCNCELEYTNKGSWYNAKKANSKCKKCYHTSASITLKEKYKNGEFNFVPRNKEREKTLLKPFKKNCPNCGDEMSYVRQETLNESIRKNNMCNRCSTIVHKKGIMNGVSKEHIQQMRASKAGFSSWEEYVEKYPKKEMYKREVWRLTYQQPLDTLENWDKRGRCGVDGAYQLDHIKSINWGWENKVSAEVIAEWSNLRMIPWKENRDKW